MANKIDSESTAAVTDPSSDVDSSGDSSSVGESQQKDVKTTPIQNISQTRNDPQSVPAPLDKGTVHKPEKSKDVDSSGDSSSVAESKEKDVKTTPIQNISQTRNDPQSVPAPFNEGAVHKSEKSKEVKTTPIQNISQTGNDPQSVPAPFNEGAVHKSEESKEGVDSSGDSSSVGGSQEKDVKTTPIQNISQIANDPQSVPAPLDKGNDHKSEESKDVDSSGDSSSVGESQQKDVKTTPIQNISQTRNNPQSVPAPFNEGAVHKSEESKEDVDSSGDSSSVAESKEKDVKTTPIQNISQTRNDPQSVPAQSDKGTVHESEKSKEVKTTPIQNISQTGNDPQSVPAPLDKGIVHKSEKSKEVKTTPIQNISQTGNDPQSVPAPLDKGTVHESEKSKEESLVNSQRPKSGGGFKHEDEANAETDENKDQVQDAEAKQEPESSWKEDGTRKRNTRRASKTDSPQPTSELPQNTQSQISVGSNNKPLWIFAAAAAAAAVVVVLVLVIFTFNFSDSTPPVPKELNVVDVFNQEMEKLKTNFPNQRPELWKRSLIHLRRHLKTEHPTEPVSLILTSGHRAERTLDCLAQCLAQAFSTALNSSVLRIDGKSKTSQDSDQVKLDIDSELKNAFEGEKLAAVIHRFEELPPGSTLIFYRYCDHENAAYKNVFLAFTVMLDAEVELPANVSLGRVEEMVQEHVKQKFVSSDKLANFNQMDVDKLSGLWSRISHLILPVAAEEKIEHQGCGDCKSF